MITSAYLTRRRRSLAEMRAELAMLLDIRNHESECVRAMQRRLLAAVDEASPPSEAEASADCAKWALRWEKKWWQRDVAADIAAVMEELFPGEAARLAAEYRQQLAARDARPILFDDGPKGASHD